MEIGRYTMTRYAVGERCIIHWEDDEYYLASIVDETSDKWHVRYDDGSVQIIAKSSAWLVGIPSKKHRRKSPLTEAQAREIRWESQLGPIADAIMNYSQNSKRHVVANAIREYSRVVDESIGKHIGFTGTRFLGEDFEDRKTALRKALVKAWKKGYRILHHGDCIGADALAHEVAMEVGYDVIVHPPNNPSNRAFCKADKGAVRWELVKPYLDRNMDIVNASSQMLAMPKVGTTSKSRGGTWHAVNYAIKVGTPVKYV